MGLTKTGGTRPRWMGGVEVEWAVVIGDSNGKSWIEKYDWPVKTINGARNRAKRMCIEFNYVEMCRYGGSAVTRSLIDVLPPKED